MDLNLSSSLLVNTLLKHISTKQYEFSNKISFKKRKVPCFQETLPIASHHFTLLEISIPYQIYLSTNTAANTTAITAAPFLSRLSLFCFFRSSSAYSSKDFLTVSKAFFLSSD